MIVKAIITTFDNIDNLKESIPVLQADDLISEIIVVNNGSKDGTKEWLNSQDGLKIIHRDNLGAGPGRNAGLDAACEFDYALMVDGGIRPLHNGTKHLLDYLQVTPEADVIGVEIHDLETNHAKAWRRWIKPIGNEDTYNNTRLSHTAYCLARKRVFDGIRFCEEGPFAMPGWGADDDELACQWQNHGFNVHVVVGIKCYRRSSGSFGRLYRETGIYPNQYGSVYEGRVVWLQQNHCQHQQGMQWGEPWLTVVIKQGDVESTAKMIKYAHDELRKRTFERPWQEFPNPYSVIVWGDGGQWFEDRRLRQHHGDKVIVNDQIIKRNAMNESTWTGDFIVHSGVDWQDAIRKNAFYYGLVTTQDELKMLIDKHNELHPRKNTHPETPKEKRQIKW